MDSFRDFYQLALPPTTMPHASHREPVERPADGKPTFIRLAGVVDGELKVTRSFPKSGHGYRNAYQRWRYCCQLWPEVAWQIYVA